MWYSHKIYLALKRNKVLMHASTWMNFESIMLSERKSVTKDHTLYDSSYVKCPEQ
jgi:hypothetical protein